MNAEEAFDVLIQALQDALNQAKQEGAEAMLAGNVEAVNLALQKVEVLDERLSTMQAMQNEWHAVLSGRVAPKRRRNRPRKAAKPSGAKIKRAERGTITTQKAYRIPILKALVELGGAATITQVLERVEQMMQDQLLPKDYEILRDGRSVRWRNTAQWERQSLVTEGLLSSESPRGIWEITDAGRAYLAEHE